MIAFNEPGGTNPNSILSEETRFQEPRVLELHLPPSLEVLAILS